MNREVEFLSGGSLLACHVSNNHVNKDWVASAKSCQAPSKLNLATPRWRRDQTVILRPVILGSVMLRPVNA